MQHKSLQINDVLETLFLKWILSIKVIFLKYCPSVLLNIGVWRLSGEQGRQKEIMQAEKQKKEQYKICSKI